MRIQHGRAFTLVEVLVGTIVLAIVTGGTTTAVSMLAKTKSVTQSRRQAMSRSQIAVSSIAADALRLVRDHDLYFTRVVIESDAQGGEATDELLLIIRTIEPVRGLFGVPEGADFEVHYRLEELESTDLAEPGEEEQFAMWRRVDPALDEYQTGGGIATQIVTGVIALSVEAFDGEEWVDSWDSDIE